MKIKYETMLELLFNSSNFAAESCRKKVLIVGIDIPKN